MCGGHVYFVTESAALSITGTRNELIAVEVALCASKIYCRLLSSFVGTALCEIAYGTDPTRKQLPLIDKSEETGHSEETLTVALTHQLESNTFYYYNLTAKGGSMNVTVLGEFRTGMCTCTLYNSFSRLNKPALPT